MQKIHKKKKLRLASLIQDDSVIGVIGVIRYTKDWVSSRGFRVDIICCKEHNGLIYLEDIRKNCDRCETHSLGRVGGSPKWTSKINFEREMRELTGSAPADMHVEFSLDEIASAHDLISGLRGSDE